tara:strand:+ start:359 stop:877 length:519 start_codon:yes stop_codon:yes gene_type:complete
MSKKCWKHTKETKKRMRQIKLEKPVRYWLGKKRSLETIRKIKEKLIKQMNTPEAKERMKMNALGKFGKKSHNWKGGKTKIRQIIPSLYEYKNWRSMVFERDNWTCQTCGGRSQIGKQVYLEAHHIKELWKIIDEFRIKNSKDAINCKELWDLSNGITLCKECHKLTKYGRRK